MSFNNSNDYLTGCKPVPIPAGCEVIAPRFGINLTTGDMALNTIGAVGILPAGCDPVDCFVDSDDLDSNGTPALVMQIGLLNAAGTAFDVVFGSTTIGRSGGQDRIMSKELARCGASSVDRKIGIKVTTAPATAVAGAVGVSLTYKAL